MKFDVPFLGLVTLKDKAVAADVDALGAMGEQTSKR